MLRNVPVLKLLAAAEIGLLARDHVARLNRQERRRLWELIRIGRGRRSNLSEAEREEMASLIDKMEPRVLFGRAIDTISPVQLPRRLVYGRSRRRRGA